MRVVITGGAGCLGSSIVPHLAQRAESVLVIDNFETGHREWLPEVENLQVVEGSIVDRGLVSRLFSQVSPTHVIHAAASYKDPSNWASDVETNVMGSVIVAQACMEAGVKRVVNLQTALCYGVPEVVPIPTSHALRPSGSYAVSKTAGEAYMLGAELSVASLRIANVIGPNLSIGPIPTFAKRIPVGEACTVSTAVRDFLDVEDFIALLDLVLDESAPAGVFNASSGEGRSILEVFRAVATHLGYDDVEPVAIVEPGADDVPSVVLDPTTSRDVFGWSAAVSFENSIARMIDWYRANGIGTIHSHLKTSGGQR